MATSLDEEHNMCRTKVCLICYRKSRRTISALEANFIASNVMDGYLLEDLNLPCGLCGGCELLLRKRMDNDTIILPWSNNLDPERPTNLRSISSCTCRICNVAKASGIGFRFKKKKRGRPKAVEEGEEDSRKKKFRLCTNCFEKVYVGCNHPCNGGRATRVKNLEALMSPGTKEALAARTIDNSLDKSLTTLESAKKTLNQQPPAAKKSLFSAQDMNKIQLNNNLSTRGLKGLAQDMREASGSRSVVEPNLLQKNHAKNHLLDDYFEIKTLSFHQILKETKAVENIERPVVLCKDLQGFVDFIIETRNLDSSKVSLRIGLDGGGGFIKICLSVFNPEDTMKDTCLSKQFKHTGVKKALILALVPKTQENQFNVKRLWINSNIDDLKSEFTIATDLKMINILLGIQNHACNHPCSWCDITKENLINKGKSRTLASLDKLFWRYYDSGDRKAKAKDHGNVIHPSMIKSTDTNTPILLLVPPPELHLMLGTVNHLYNNMEKLWPGATAWLDACHVKKQDYHDGAFIGNDCRKLLKKVSVLREMESRPKNTDKYVEAFESFNKVVGECFGNHLAPEYEESIQEFASKFKNLKISVTPKIHAVIHHVKEFCDIKGKGLGQYSEQTSESIHHDFNETWKNYFMKDCTREEYAERLLNAVRNYNGLHI